MQSSFDAQSTGERLYGSGNVSFGVRLVGGLFTGPADNRVLTGTAGDLAVSGITKTWAQTPYYDQTTGSGAMDPTVSNRATGTFNFNGATPVAVAVASIQASDSVIVYPTAAGGTLGAWAITSQTPGVGFTIVSVAGNANAAFFALKKG